MISQNFSKTYEPLFHTSARYILLWGGRGRGGSYTATAYFLHLLTSTAYFRGYFMREIFGDIRGSLWADFKDRIEENDTINPVAIGLNESQMVAHCRTTGNYIMSKGFKKGSKGRTAKLKSLAGATHVVIEEAEEISLEDFMQLDDSIRSVRSSIKIILIFNPPPKAHWIWEKWFHLIEAPRPADIRKKDWAYFRAVPKTTANVLSIFSTYMDNLANINPSSIAIWQGYRQSNPDWYWTIIMGLISEGAHGRIYKNFRPCADMPGLYSKFYGLDWGWTDPLCLVELESHKGKKRTLWMDEKIYETGMDNDKLEERLIALGIPKRAPIIADSAEPKDNQEMRRRGWNFIDADKGPGSVRSGIRYLQQFVIFVTERSKNLWRENRDYAWALDQHKEPTEEPIDANNHGMDAMRYGAERLRNPSGMAVVKAVTEGTGNGRSEYNM